MSLRSCFAAAAAAGAPSVRPEHVLAPAAEPAHVGVANTTGAAGFNVGVATGKTMWVCNWPLPEAATVGPVLRTFIDPEGAEIFKDVMMHTAVFHGVKESLSESPTGPPPDALGFWLNGLDGAERLRESAAETLAIISLPARWWRRVPSTRPPRGALACSTARAR